MRYFLDINYEDGDQSTYKSIEISGDDNFLKKFNTGEITVDFIDYIKWVADLKDLEMINYTSSWDHFFMDGDEYKTLYVSHDNNESKVIKNSDFDALSIAEINKLFQYPVRKYINTFEELKKFYKQKKT